MIKKTVFMGNVEQVLNHFPKHHMKNVLRDFNAKVWRENIFKTTIWNESTSG